MTINSTSSIIISNKEIISALSAAFDSDLPGGRIMDIKVLEEFVTICETLSFQETAYRLNISQSALTKHIHKMEEELGVSLFDRSTRSVSQNEFGQLYYPYAEQIVRTAKEGAATMNRLSLSDESNLQLAFTSTCSQYGIIEMISEFSKEHPQYNLKITESFLVCDMILGNQCDFAFANDAIHFDERIDRLVYKVDQLALYVPAGDPLAAETEIPIAALDGKKMIAHSRSSGAFHLDTLNFQASCRNAGFEPDFAASMSYTSTIMKMIKEKQGIAALYQGQIPADQLDPEIKAIRLIPKIESEVYLLYNRRHKHTEARKAFMNFLLHNRAQVPHEKQE